MRHAAVAIEIERTWSCDTGAVQARDAPRVQPEIGQVVRSLHILLHAVHSRVGIEEERGTERPRLTCSEDSGVGFPAASPVEAKIEQVEHFGVHHRELCPDLMAGRAVPVDLRVVVIAVRLRLTRESKIVLEPIVGSRRIRHWVARLNLQRDGADSIRRDDGVVEPDLVCTVIAAPPVMPWAASKLLVEILTTSIVSTGATYPA